MKPGLARVLLSTYNSERFIRPLLDSVLGQTHQPLELWVRDDGSRDSTPAILAEYAARHPERMRVSIEANVGMVPSYFKLLHWAGEEAEFTALCGHDDVWHPEKVARAVEMMRAHGSPGPILYTGRLHIVDETGQHLGYSRVPGRGLSFRNALVESVGAGCTMVLNAPARDLVLECRDASRILWEDWWLYLVVSAFGTVLYDTTPFIDYRRHGGNAVGSPGAWSLERFRQAWRLIVRQGFRHRLVHQATMLRELYGSRMPEERRRALDEFLDRPRSLLGRVRHAATCDIQRQRAIDGLVIRLLLLGAGPSPS